LSICQLHILLSRTAHISLELHFCVELRTRKKPWELGCKSIYIGRSHFPQGSPEYRSVKRITDGQTGFNSQCSTPLSIRREWKKAQDHGHHGESSQRTSAVFASWWWWFNGEVRI